MDIPDRPILIITLVGFIYTPPRKRLTCSRLRPVSKASANTVLYAKFYQVTTNGTLETLKKKARKCIF